MVTVKRPTILVGIGGTGCLIAERVLGQARDAGLTDLERVCIIGMDTDIKDLRKLRNIEKRFRIQTSDNRSLRQLLMQPNWSAIEKWHLPKEAFSEDTLSKPLLSGAGQIRMLSRLATFLAFKEGDAEDRFKEAIGRVTKMRSNAEHDGEVQVVITCSLAGATGSGSFLQVASIMDQLCRVVGVSAFVRGVFLLGDVMVRTQTLQTDQIVNAQFNTYAALAELNACNAYAAGLDAPSDFSFEVAPGMLLQRGVPPLRTVTLIDYESDIGTNLGTDRDAYYGMAVRAVYQYVFTPIGQRLDSVMINAARSQQRAEVMGRKHLYSGIGVHSITYPKQAIAEYLELEYARQNLGGEWLLLDELYERAYRVYETQRRTDPSVRRPDIGENFLANFKMLTEQSAFIKQLHLSLHPGGLDLDGNLAEPVHLSYLRALVDEVLKQYWAVAPLPTVVGDLRLPTSAQLEETEDLPATVSKVEQALDRAWRAVQSTSATVPADIFRTLFSTGLEPERLGGMRDFHLKKWLVNDKLHLVAIRWFLYALRAHLRDERPKLKPEVVETTVLGLGSQFRDPKKKVEAENANTTRARSNPEVHERAREAASRGFLGIGDKRKKFAQQYFQYHQTSQSKIKEWAELRVKEQIYEGLLRELDGIISLVEATFDRVKELKRKLDNEITEVVDQHSARKDRGLFDGVLYVLSEPEDKQRIASDALREASQSVEEGAETNGAIGELVFKEYLTARRISPLNPADAISKLDANELGNLLRDRLIGVDAREVVGKRLRGHYDFSVWRAVEQDWRARKDEADRGVRAGQAAARIIADSPEKHLEGLVEEVRRHAQPFIDYRDQSVGNPILFWSVNPKIVEEFGDRARLMDILKSSPGEDPDISDVHSNTQILCTHVRANLDLSDLTKLHPGDGSNHARGVGVGIYRRAYLEEVEPLRRSLAPHGRSSGHITPHIDRTWHKDGVLPEIFPEMQKQVMEEIDRAIVMAIALDLVEKATPLGEGPMVYLDLSKLPGGVGSRTPIANSHDTWDIVGALRRHSERTLAVQSLWDVRLRGLTEATAPLFDERQLGDFVAPLLEIATKRADPIEEARRRATIESLVLRAFELSALVTERLRPQLTPRARADLVATTGEQALRTATAAVSARYGLTGAEARPMEELVERIVQAFRSQM